MRKFSIIKRVGVVGAVVLATGATLPLSAAYATLPADQGLDVTLNLPEVDVSGLGAAPQCVVGSVGQKITIRRDPTSTVASEYLTGAGSSNCAGLKITVTILDHAVVPTSSDLQVTRTLTTTGKKISGSVSQSVSWAAVNAAGIRPLTQVTFKTTVSHGSASNCSALQMDVVAGSTYNATPVAC